jgi:hypothetical protein
VTFYQSSDDRSLKNKQHKHFKKLTQAVYVQKQEVATKDGYRLVEPMIDRTSKPHELHLIKKTSGVTGEPWWVREALEKLGFVSLRDKEWTVTYSVRPNTREVNDTLWLCKHMVRVVPVRFKNGYHPAEKDLGNTRLNLVTGELEIIKPLVLRTHEPTNAGYFKLNGVNVTADLKPADTFGLDKAELHRDMHRQRQMCKLNDEFFPTAVHYKYDQDKPGVIRVKGAPSTDLNEDNVSDEVPY